MGHPVVHFEINGPDGETLERFYGELFGWDVRPLPDIGYALVDTRGGAGINGGIGTNRDGRAFVTFYAQAEYDELQPLLDKAEQLGATTVIPLTESPMVTFAMFADPDGLFVGVVKREEPQEGVPQGPSEGDGAAVDWFEVLGTDDERTRRFYLELFGWETQGGESPGYTLVHAHDEHGQDQGAGGGIGAGEGGPWVTMYAVVPDVEAGLARAQGLGGSTVYGPNDLPEGLRTAAFRDPAGNVFGLYQRG